MFHVRKALHPWKVKENNVWWWWWWWSRLTLAGLSVKQLSLFSIETCTTSLNSVAVILEEREDGRERQEWIHIVMIRKSRQQEHIRVTHSKTGIGTMLRCVHIWDSSRWFNISGNGSGVHHRSRSRELPLTKQGPHWYSARCCWAIWVAALVFINQLMSEWPLSGDDQFRWRWYIQAGISRS